jgi:hypothetical protein
MDYLRSIKSDGIVMSCKIMPAGLRAHAQQQGQFCCVTPPNW